MYCELRIECLLGLLHECDEVYRVAQKVA